MTDLGLLPSGFAQVAGGQSCLRAIKPGEELTVDYNFTYNQHRERWPELSEA